MEHRAKPDLLSAGLGYKPTALRRWFVAIICLASLVLITLVELSCRLLPSEKDLQPLFISARPSNTVLPRDAPSSTRLGSGTIDSAPVQPTPGTPWPNGPSHSSPTRSTSPETPSKKWATTTRYESVTATTSTKRDCVVTQTDMTWTVTSTVTPIRPITVTTYASTSTVTVRVNSDPMYLTTTITSTWSIPKSMLSILSKIVLVTRTKYIDTTLTEFLPVTATMVTKQAGHGMANTTTTTLSVLTPASVRNPIGRRHDYAADLEMRAADSVNGGIPGASDPESLDIPIWTTIWKPLSTFTITVLRCASTTTTTTTASWGYYSRLSKEITTTLTTPAPITTSTIYVSFRTGYDAIGVPMLKTLTPLTKTVTDTVLGYRDDLDDFDTLRAFPGLKYFTPGRTTLTRTVTALVQRPQDALSGVVGAVMDAGTVASVLVIVSESTGRPADGVPATIWAEPLSRPIPASAPGIPASALDKAYIGDQTHVGPTATSHQVSATPYPNGIPTRTAQQRGSLSSSVARITAPPNREDNTSWSVSAIVHLTNSKGVVTATTTIPVLPTQTKTIATDEVVVEDVYVLTMAQYFAGFFLPTVLAVLFRIPIHVLNANAMRYQPFHALAQANGATGRESLCLRMGFLPGLYSSVAGLAHGHGLTLPLLTALLVIMSTALVPLASEAVLIKLVGSCNVIDARGCAAVLTVASVPARVTMAWLVAMLVLLVYVWYRLRRWGTGVPFDPWSLAAIMALSTDSLLHSSTLLARQHQNGQINAKQLVKLYGKDCFRLNLGGAAHDPTSYGIILVSNPTAVEGHLDSTSTRGNSAAVKPETTSGSGFVVGRIKGAPLVRASLFLIFACGILAVIQYNNISADESEWERFMDGQTFGVRFLFTAIGAAVSLFWNSFFHSEYRFHDSGRPLVFANKHPLRSRGFQRPFPLLRPLPRPAHVSSRSPLQPASDPLLRHLNNHPLARPVPDARHLHGPALRVHARPPL